MSAAAKKRGANGAVALVLGASRLIQLDDEGQEFATLMEKVVALMAAPDFKHAAIGGAPVGLLKYRLLDWKKALIERVTTRTGERDYRKIAERQTEVRDMLNRCNEAMFDRCYQVWLDGGPVPELPA